MIRRQIDSVGAGRWLRRAETMARSIKKRTGTARAILDGYLVEGRRNGEHRLARVLDLPGRFVPFGHTGTAIGIPGASESWWPQWTAAPTRKVMLEQGPPEEGEPPELPYDHPQGRNIAAHFIGEAPSTGLRSLGIAAPTTSADWVTQVRTVYPNTDPVPAVNANNLTINYSGVSALWVMVDAWGAGNLNKFTMLINEQEIHNVFGAPIIQKTWSDYSRQQSDTRAWATVISHYKVAVAVWLSDGAPAGQAGSLGLVIYEAIDGDWVLAMSRRIRHEDMPHPLFQAHYRVSAGGGPLLPPRRSFLRPREPVMMGDGSSVVFLTTLYHELDATVGEVYRSIVVTGLLRVEIDLEDYSVAAGIDHINTDAELHWGSVATGSNLVTTNGVLVSGAISYQWEAGEWPVYCWMHYDRTTLHEVTAFVRGIRGDYVWPPGLPAYGGHTYQSQVIRWRIKTTQWVEEAPVVEDVDIYANAAGFTAMVAPGRPLTVLEYPPTYTGPLIYGMTEGGNAELPMAYCGERIYEMAMYRGDSTQRVVMRISAVDGTVSEVPGTDKTQPVPTCYAYQRTIQTSDGERVIPHRSLFVYRQAGETVIEARSGDDVFAVSRQGRDYRVGLYYLGNPYSSMRYGLMGADT